MIELLFQSQAVPSLLAFALIFLILTAAIFIVNACYLLVKKKTNKNPPDEKVEVYAVASVGLMFSGVSAYLIISQMGSLASDAIASNNWIFFGTGVTMVLVILFGHKQFHKNFIMRFDVFKKLENYILTGKYD